MSKPFRRECRYFVIKRKNLLPGQEARLVDLLAEFVAEGAKPGRQCVVVESNRPYYNAVWGLIQAEAEGCEIKEVAYRTSKTTTRHLPPREQQE